jgi:hypothetical protein
LPSCAPLALSAARVRSAKQRTLLLGECGVDVQHERVGTGTVFGDDERHLPRHQAADEGDVARETVELGDDDGSLVVAGLRQRWRSIGRRSKASEPLPPRTSPLGGITAQHRASTPNVLPTRPSPPVGANGEGLFPPTPFQLSYNSARSARLGCDLARMLTHSCGFLLHGGRNCYLGCFGFVFPAVAAWSLLG